MWDGNLPFLLPWQLLQVSFVQHTPSTLQQYYPLGILTKTEVMFFNEQLIFQTGYKKWVFYSFSSSCYGTMHLTARMETVKLYITVMQVWNSNFIPQNCAYCLWSYALIMLEVQLSDQINLRLCKNSQLLYALKVQAGYKSCHPGIPLHSWFSGFSQTAKAVGLRAVLPDCLGTLCKVPFC